MKWYMLRLFATKIRSELLVTIFVGVCGLSMKMVSGTSSRVGFTMFPLR